MSNQTNVYLIGAQTLYERNAREVDLSEGSNLSQPPGYMPLLQWISRELERAGGGDEYHYAFDEIEELLLFDDGGFGSPGIDFATQFEKTWALTKDLETIAPFVDASLRHRLKDENFLEGAEFPEHLEENAPLRLLDFPGWQFFDRHEVDAILGAVRGALQQGKEILYVEEWEQFATEWRKKRYDLSLFWWLI